MLLNNVWLNESHLKIRPYVPLFVSYVRFTGTVTIVSVQYKVRERNNFNYDLNAD